MVFCSDEILARHIRLSVRGQAARFGQLVAGACDAALTSGNLGALMSLLRLPVVLAVLVLFGPSGDVRV